VGALEAQLVDHLLQEPGPAQQRFQQGDLEVGPDQRQHHTREAGSRADVADVRTMVEGRRDLRAVEQVALPQPGDLARPQQPAVHSRTREQVGISPRLRPPSTKHRRDPGGRRRCFT
jgi:hypothetical protein